MDPSVLASPHTITSLSSLPSTGTQSQGSPLSPLSVRSSGELNGQLAPSQVDPLSPSAIDLSPLSVQPPTRNPSSSSISPLPSDKMNPPSLQPPRPSPVYDPYTAHQTTHSAGPDYSNSRSHHGASAMPTAYAATGHYQGIDEVGANATGDDGDDNGDEGGGMDVDDAEPIAGPGRATGGTKSQNFVKKLWCMMDDPASAPYIKWAPDGKGFVITNHTEFATNVLGRIFKHSNFQSFVRQLNMYDFHKINRAPRAQRGALEPQHWHFTHALFIRGRQDLLSQIKRKATEPGHVQGPFYPPPADVPVSIAHNEQKIVPPSHQDSAAVITLTQRVDSLEKLVEELKNMLYQALGPRSLQDRRSSPPMVAHANDIPTNFHTGESGPSTAPMTNYPTSHQSGIAQAHNLYTSHPFQQTAPISASNSSASMSPSDDGQQHFNYDVVTGHQQPATENLGYSSAVQEPYQPGVRHRGFSGPSAQTSTTTHLRPNNYSALAPGMNQAQGAPSFSHSMASSSSHSLQVPNSLHHGHPQSFGASRSDQGSPSRSSTPTQSQGGQGGPRFHHGVPNGPLGGRNWPVSNVPPHAPQSSQSPGNPTPTQYSVFGNAISGFFR